MILKRYDEIEEAERVIGKYRKTFNHLAKLHIGGFNNKKRLLYAISAFEFPSFNNKKKDFYMQFLHLNFPN